VTILHVRFGPDLVSVLKRQGQHSRVMAGIARVLIGMTATPRVLAVLQLVSSSV
jgi:hypothetical protein